MIRRLILYLLSSGLIVTSSVAQDPHFSQFFNSGYLVNPALIGSSTSDWRVTGNVRQQWNNAETPYNTASVNFETRVLKNVTNNNRLGVAAAFMSDQSLNGAFKTNVSSTSLAYHVNINSESFIGLGMTGQFFSRTLDLSALTFGEHQRRFQYYFTYWRNSPLDHEAICIGRSGYAVFFQSRSA
jgi:type IX secretion system PorP/SprF family membrane protein